MRKDFEFNNFVGDDDIVGEIAIENTFQMITGKVSLEEVIELMDGYLIFNTFDYDEDEVRGELMDYYLENRDFDRCKEISNLKKFKIYEYESDRAEAED